VLIAPPLAPCIRIDADCAARAVDGMPARVDGAPALAAVGYGISRAEGASFAHLALVARVIVAPSFALQAKRDVAADLAPTTLCFMVACPLVAPSKALPAEQRKYRKRVIWRRCRRWEKYRVCHCREGCDTDTISWEDGKEDAERGGGCIRHGGVERGLRQIDRGLISDGEARFKVKRLAGGI